MKTRILLAALGLASTFPASVDADPATAWRNDVAAAFETARTASKPVLVDLYADWCGWCKVMERRVFPDPAFRSFTAGFVLLRVDVEDRGDGGELAARYDAGTLPTLLLLEPSGALVGAVQGFVEAPELVQRLKAEQAIHTRRVQAYEAALASDDVRRLEPMALDFYARNDGPRAAALFERLLEHAPQTGDRGAWSLYLFADSLRLARRFDAARAAAERARRGAETVADDELAERVALLPFWISRDAARCADASGVLERFAAEHPRSVLLPGARNAFARLSSAAETCS